MDESTKLSIIYLITSNVDFVVDRLYERFGDELISVIQSVDKEIKQRYISDKLQEITDLILALDMASTNSGLENL